MRVGWVEDGLVGGEVISPFFFFPCSLPAFRKGKKKKKSSCLPLLFFFFSTNSFFPTHLSFSLTLLVYIAYIPFRPPPSFFFFSFLFTAFHRQTNSQLSNPKYSLKLPTSESNFQVDLHNKFERFKIQDSRTIYEFFV